MRYPNVCHSEPALFAGEESPVDYATANASRKAALIGASAAR
jgi:hypothetical protein